MKLKNLFYFLLALPLVFAACGENPEPEPIPEVKDPVLTLTCNNPLVFEAEGGEATIAYAIENAVEGVELQASCEAEWVENVTVAEDITFTVAANEAEEARDAVLTVVYGDIEKSVAIQQAGKTETPKAPVFELVSEETMEFGQEQTLGTIEFKLENPIENVEVSAKANASWISNVTVKESTIEFVVAANDGAAREAKITATYGMLEFKVTVKQAAYVAPAPVLEITSTLEPFAFEGGDGVLAYVLENAVEGVELQATADVEWITINSAADGVVAFTVAKNETSSQRGGNITLTYGEVSATAKVEQLFDGYDSNMNYSVFSVIETWADSKNGGKQWNVTFVEKVDLMGECQTVITFYMEEGNAQRIVDGTYSVANGGILVNSASQNGYSTYRGNTSESINITDAEFTVSVDTEAKEITINGTFQAGTNIVTLNYTGGVRGMDLTESTGAANHVTEWTSFTGKYWNGYNSDSEFMFQGVSADGSVEVMFDCYTYPKVTDKIAPEGEYTIAPWEAKQNYVDGDKFVMDQSTITLNTIKANLKSGTLTVEHISGGYKVSFNFVDTLDREVSGVFEGTLTGGTMNQPE
jgi:hypothetical protein